MNTPQHIPAQHPSQPATMVLPTILQTLIASDGQSGAESSQKESGTKTLLHPPRGAVHLVGRERLLSQLIEARRKRCVVIQSSVGSGKTSLLLAWREELLLLGFDITWQTFTSDDNDLTLCIDNLIANLSQINPEICREAALLIGRGMDDETVERVIIALVRGIAQHPADIVLILDDVHYLTNTRNHEALQWLLDYAPQNLHIVLASRASLPLSLSRLRDQGQVLELNMRDLRFTPAESEEFLKEQLGQISSREARRIHELTDGWVAGLRLFAVRLERARQNTTDNKTEHSTSTVTGPWLLNAHAFEELFEREVLSYLPASQVELLVRISICTRLCAPLCIALSNDGQQPGEVLAFLEKLANDNLFITPIVSTDNQSWYSLHPLFREMLLERFHTRSEAYQREIHQAAWIWFRDHNLPDDAVRHALLAGEPAAAIQLVRQEARTMRIQGNFRKLVGLMRLLPSAEIQAHFDLRIWLAMLHLYTRELDACAVELDRLETDIPADNLIGRYQITVLRAGLAVQRDDTDTASRLEPELLNTPAGADDLLIGGRNNILTWLYAHQSKFEQARRIQSESPKLLVNGAALLNTSSGMLNGRSLAGFSYALEGKFVQAERIYRDVLFDAQQNGNAATEATCLATALLGEVLYESNDLEGARKLLEDRVDILERVSIPDSVLRMHTTLSAIHWAAGHHQEAFAYLQRLEDYATQYGLHRLVAHSIAEQVNRHLALDQFDTAQDMLTRLDAMVAHAIASQSTFSAKIQRSAERSHINWCIAHKDFDGAAARLTKLIAHCDAHGWQRHLARAQMLSALVDYRSGRLDSARKSVLEVLSRGSRLGLVRSLIDLAPDALELITQVMQSEPHDPVLSFYFSRLQATRPSDSGSKPTANKGSGAQTAGAEALSERETKVVSLLAQALPNKKIARILCISPETVKWHLKNIYGKLGVASRDEAVARVRDLMLGSTADT